MAQKRVVSGTVVDGPAAVADGDSRADRMDRAERTDRGASDDDDEPKEDKPKPKDEAARSGTSPKKEPPSKPLVERASTVPNLDPNVFGYYWEPTPGAAPEWHVFAGDPALFRATLADALLNKRMTRLYFSASGIWVQVPLPPINSI